MKSSTLENVSLLVQLGLETKKTHLLNIAIFILVDQSVDYELQKFLYRGWQTLDLMRDRFKDSENAKFLTSK